MIVFTPDMRNADLQRLKIIDSHTEGEPTRVVIELPDDVVGLDKGSMAERQTLMREQYDWIRTACILEPRGNEAMVGNEA